MRIDRAPLVLIAAAAVACEDPGPPSGSRHVTLHRGSPQTDTVGQDLPQPFDVIVTDLRGAPIAGVPVSWTAILRPGSFSAPVTTTDATGHAFVTYRLGPVVGLQQVEARVDHAPEVPRFQVNAVAGPPAVSEKVGGDLQSGDPGTRLNPYWVRVTDSFGNIVGVTVQFVVRGGSISTTTAVTSFGAVSTTHTLGPDAGADTVLAIVPILNDTLVFVSRVIGRLDPPVQVLVPANYGLHDTYVRDGIAFACVWNTGIIVYDVGDGRAGGSPTAPVAIDTVRTNDNGVPGGRQVHNAWWFHNPVSDEKRYLFVGQEGPLSVGTRSSGDIHVVDVSDLSNPVEVASYRLAGAGVHNFWVDEAAQILYAAFYNGGVVALDVSGTLTGDLANREVGRIRPGGDGNTFTWGVQVHPNGSLYAIDMLSGLWQLRRNGSSLSVVAGGNNVPERYSSDLWAHGEYVFSGTWGRREQNGDALKVWRIDASGAPTLVATIVTPSITTVSDVQVSDDGQVLVFSAEGGTGAGLYVYGLQDPRNPVLMARFMGISLHTATIADIGGRRYVFAAKNPGFPALAIFDITDFAP